MVSSATRATSRLVETILASAAVEAGAIAVTPEEVPLAGALGDAVELCGMSAVVELALHDPKATVWCDRVHLDQVVANLLTNARRYGAPPVVLRTRAAGRKVVISVSDAGGGVPGSEVADLFGRFARTGDRQARAKGTGFGLYMSSRLADANGGALTYQVSDAEPHRFELTLPAARPPGFGPTAGQGREGSG